MNGDDYSEAGGSSICPWTWVMLTTWIMLTIWKCSRMDWSEQLASTKKMLSSELLREENPGRGQQQGVKLKRGTLSHSKLASLGGCNLSQQVHIYHGCSLGKMHITKQGAQMKDFQPFCL